MKVSITAIVTAVSIGLGMFAHSIQAAQSASTQQKVVMVTASKTGNSVALGGTVVPFKEVTLTAQLAGTVNYIAGTEGDSVEERQVLVAINDDDLRARRRAALAELGNATNAVQSARVQYSRELWSPQSKSLSRTPGMGMPSMFDQMFTQPMASTMPGNNGGNQWIDRQADLHDYGSRISQAQGQRWSAQSRIEEIDTKIRDAQSIAPFAGVIVNKLVEVGDTVQPGQPMLVFADTSYLQVKVDIPSRLMPGISKGMMIPTRLDVGNALVQARVAQIFPVADAQRHTVTVKLDLPRGVQGGAGMYAEIMVNDVSMPVSDVPVVPASAIVWRGSLPAVFVIDKNNKRKLRLIRVGGDQGDGFVSVLSGVSVGEQIMSNPSSGTSSGWSRSGH